MAKNSLREWFGQNDGKGWVDCKTGKPCGRQKEKTQRLSGLQTNYGAMYFCCKEEEVFQTNKLEG